MIRLSRKVFISPETTFTDPGDTASSNLVFNHNLGSDYISVEGQYTFDSGVTWRKYPGYFSTGAANRGFLVFDIDATSIRINRYRIVAGTSITRFILVRED